MTDATPTAVKAILTVEDVMERWGVSRDTVLAHVDNPDHPLPAIPLGRQAKKGMNRKLLRFRLAAVEEWERAAERRAVRPEPAAPPPGRPAGYGGKVYTRPATNKPTAKVPTKGA